MAISIYEKLVQKNLIKEEKFRQEPNRVRAKAKGWMWEAKYEVTTKNDEKYIFKMWNHFFEDDGSLEWKPSIEDIRKHMYCQFVPRGKGLVSHSWNSVLVNNIYYTSKKGFFGYENRTYQKEMIEQIKNGTWKENPDIEMLL
jgi:hypothetical protein